MRILLPSIGREEQLIRLVDRIRMDLKDSDELMVISDPGGYWRVMNKYRPRGMDDWFRAVLFAQWGLPRPDIQIWYANNQYFQEQS